LKLSIWDILSVVMILATLCLCGGFGMIWTDESSAFNPFPPPTLQPTIQLVIPTVPTATVTPRIRVLPPTWTHTPQADQNEQPQQPGLRASSTPMPTFTSFVVPSLTPSITPSNTPTNTPTVTNSPTATLIPTHTLIPTFTQVPTETLTPTP
jgi:hypothetical protein